MPPGVKMLLNSGASHRPPLLPFPETNLVAIHRAGEFYAQDFGTANLELLARFFEKYPEYAERTFLSVKGGGKKDVPAPDAS